MTAIADLLKPTEAAVVSGVDLSIVNHAIDRMLPERLVRRGRGRSVSAEACFYIAFYHGSASKLTADERRFAIFTVDKRAEETDDPQSPWRSLVRHCRVQHEFLHIDLKPFLTQTHERWNQYVAAREMVTTDADVLGGAPVIKGTRVPVHDIATSVAEGVPTARILKAYPALNAEQVGLAILYAKANPSQGRPPERRLPGGAKVVSQRVVARRQTRA